MIVLAIDTCDARGGVAVLREGEIVAQRVHDTKEEYSAWLLPAVEEVLKEAAVSMKDIYGYGVAAGPGSFTGVRVGLSTAKAWGEVYGKPIAGISRLEAVALQVGAGTDDVAVWLDAQRGQVFGAVYRRAGVRFVRLADEMVIAPGRFVQAAAELAGAKRISWVTPDPDCVVNLDEWQEREKLKESLQVVPGFLAGAVARMAANDLAAGRHTDVLALEANYVRRSDAEIFWKGSAGHGR